MSDIINKFIAIKQETPKWLFYFIIFCLAWLFIMVVWLPSSCWDANAFYLSRIKYEEFGPLERTGTVEFQAVFPKFHDYLHAPFLKIGYFEFLPNFLFFAFTIFLVIMLYSTRQAMVSLLLMFIAVPVWVQAGGQKNDLILGLLFYWGILLTKNFYERTWYMPSMLLLMAALTGTKWTGIPLAGLLFILMAFSFYKQSFPRALSFAISFLMVPFYLFASSANVYFNNYKIYGSPVIRFDWIDQSTPFFKNSILFIIACFQKEFDKLLYLWSWLFKGGDGNIEAIYSSIGLKTVGYYPSLVGAEGYTPFGILPLLIIAFALLGCLRKNCPVIYRLSFGLGIAALIFMLMHFGYFPVSDRYFLSIYFIFLPAAMHFFTSTTIPPFYKHVAVICLVVSTFMGVFLPRERLSLPLPQLSWDGQHTFYPSTIWPDFFNRDRLRFINWSGYQHIYDYMQDNIQLDDSLLFIGYHQGNDAPFLYPLIKDRQAANTSLVSLRNGTDINSIDFKKYKYVMAYKGALGAFAHPDYKPVYRYEQELGKMGDVTREMSIFKRIDSEPEEARLQESHENDASTD